MFREMLTSDSTKTVVRMQVYCAGGKYYVERNSEVTAGTGALVDILQCVEHEVLLHLIQARPDLLWFHGAAAASAGRAVVIAGPAGQGKSTLVTTLCANGWAYLSDDILPLDMASSQVIPFPQTPAVRIDPGVELPSVRLPELQKADVELSPETVCREAMPIAAMVFPTYDRHSPTRISHCPPAEATLELLQHCLNFVNHRETAVCYLSNLLKHLPAFRLTFSNAVLATELIGRVHQ
jgi:hypothetical protein